MTARISASDGPRGCLSQIDAVQVPGDVARLAVGLEEERGLPGRGGPDEVAADHRAWLAGIRLPAQHLRLAAGGERHDEHRRVRREPQLAEGRLPAGRDLRDRGYLVGQRYQRQDGEHRDRAERAAGPASRPRPAAPARPAAGVLGARHRRQRPVQREHEQRGGRAVGEDGEPPRQHLGQPGQALQIVPRQQPPRPPDVAADGQAAAAECAQLKHCPDHRRGPDPDIPPEHQRGDHQDKDQRPAQVVHVLGGQLQGRSGFGRAGVRVKQQRIRRHDEPAEIAGQRGPQLAVLGQRAGELRPQRVPVEEQEHHRRDGQPGQALAGAPRHFPGAAQRERHHQDQARDHRVDEELFPDEQLRGAQQPEPEAGPDAAPATGDQAGDGIDDQRRQDRELQMVMAEARRHERRGKPVDRPAERGRAETRPPPPQHPEQGGRRPREAQRQRHGQADLRAPQQRHRRQQHPWQQERRVPHQVDADWRVHRGREQRGQLPVRHSRRRVLHEPREQVHVAAVAGLHAASRIDPQPAGDHQRADEVAGQDEPCCP